MGQKCLCKNPNVLIFVFLIEQIIEKILECFVKLDPVIMTWLFISHYLVYYSVLQER